MLEYLFAPIAGYFLYEAIKKRDKNLQNVANEVFALTTRLFPGVKKYKKEQEYKNDFVYLTLKKYGVTERIIEHIIEETEHAAAVSLWRGEINKEKS